MGAIIKYRDLPGGPTDVQLGEELSRHCLCSHCGMLSMTMYQDRNEHVFCGACIEERSYKYHSYAIYCKSEQRDVSLYEMFEANDVVTMIRDQFSMCPNKKCEKFVPLQALSEHYSQCTPKIQCRACNKEVRSQEWTEHWKKHTYAPFERNSTMGAREDVVDGRGDKLSTKHSPKNSVHGQRFQPGYAHGSSGRNDSCSTLFTSPPATRSALDSCDIGIDASLGQPEMPRQPTRNHLEEGQSTSKLAVCDHCKRNVKQANLERHIEVCPKAPKHCVYCGKYVIKENMMAHFSECDQNPGNVTKATSAAGKRSPKACRGIASSEKLEAVGVNATVHGCRPLETSLPELPVIDLSLKEMKMWRDALERRLFELGISDSGEKYEALVSAITPQVWSQIPKISTSLPPDRAIEYVLNALFELNKSARYRSSDCVITKLVQNIREKMSKRKWCHI